MSYALSDLKSSFANVRLWTFISAKNIEIQYRRNLLGVFWLVISYAAPALGIGYVLSRLQGLPLEEHVPHVLLGFVGWLFINDCLVQGAAALTRNRNILLQAPLGRSTFALSLVVEKMIILLVNLAVGVGIAAVFGWRPSETLVFVPLSLLILAVAGFGTVLLVSIVSARVRDLSELIGSVMRLAFFFTPIIWSANSRSVPEESFLSIVARYNPLTYFIDVLRLPVLGQWPDTLTLAVSGGIAALVLVLGLIALQLGGRTVAFFV